VNKTTHQNSILDQSTRQAAPFSAAAMIKDEAVLQLIVEAASPRPDDTVLDVACGPGLVLCAFAPRVRQATGIDLTPAMLGTAAKVRFRRNPVAPMNSRRSTAHHTFAELHRRASPTAGMLILQPGPSRPEGKLDGSVAHCT
jgi:tRNA/tmRNA/rRNA uracil-C5-methylase (TrmA/RlmC/RlmD family)